MKSKYWIIGWLVIVTILLSVIGTCVYKVDPYFHFHKPDTDKYFYSLDNERSQNDGICKRFEYDALITGTSMTQNFKTSEFDELFNVNSIKVPFSGGTYKEINDNLRRALESNKNLKLVVRCLDSGRFWDDPNAMRSDLGQYPTYLYDNNPFNDVNYLFNRDVIFNRTYQMMMANNAEGFIPGITSFDAYYNWQKQYTFGMDSVCPDGIMYEGTGSSVYLTEDEKAMLEENIKKNVTELADLYPEVEFYYFFSPYSAVWWQTIATTGEIYKQLEAEQYVIEAILEYDNIHLFSFNNRTDIITDINNYKDVLHYGEWINSLMLKWMHDGKYLLTKDNYLDYLSKECDYYTKFDYNILNDQIDYESDFYAAALLNEELTDEKPVDLLNDSKNIFTSNAEIIRCEVDGQNELECVGTLERDVNDSQEIGKYLLENYSGAKIEVSQVGKHRYLTFEGKKVSGTGEPSVYVYDANQNIVGSVSDNYLNLNDEWHQYVIDLSTVEGKITIIFNGAYLDNTGDSQSIYQFKNIILY